MFLPLYDDNPVRRAPVVVYVLVAVNVLTLLFSLRLDEDRLHEIHLRYGFVPARVAQWNDPRPLGIPMEGVLREGPRGEREFAVRTVELSPSRGEIVLSLFTCMFQHAGWLHLLGNMWFLWLFGNNVEDRLGHGLFLLLYLAGGLMASACHWAMGPNSLSPVIGASGAVAAVLGAYAVTWPWARVHTLVFLLFIVTTLELPALLVLGAWFAGQLINVGPQLRGAEAGGVAWWAHIGGFLAGMAMMPLLATLGPRKLPPNPDTLPPTTSFPL